MEKFLKEVAQKVGKDPVAFYGAYWLYEIVEILAMLEKVFPGFSGKKERFNRRLFRELSGLTQPTAKRVWDKLTALGLNPLAEE